MEPLETENFGYKLATEEEGIRVFQSPVLLDNVSLAHLDLLAISGTGYLACSNTTSVVLDTTRTIEQEETPKTVAGFEQVTQVCFSHDLSCLYVVDSGRLLGLKSDHFSDPTKQAFDSVLTLEKISAIAPSRQHNAVLALTMDAKLHILQDKHQQQVADKVAAFAWASEDNIITAHKNTVSVLNASGKEVTSYLAADDLEAVSVISLGDGRILASFANTDDSLDLQSFSMGPSQPPQPVDIAPPYADIERKNVYYSSLVSDWLPGKDITFVISSKSTAVDTVIHDTSKTSVVEQINETERAQMPLDDEGDDASALGLAVDLSHTATTVLEVSITVESATGVLPKLWCLTQMGTLVAWWVFAAHEVKDNSLSLLRAQNAIKHTRPLELTTSESLSKSGQVPETPAVKNSSPFGSVLTSSTSAQPENPTGSKTQASGFGASGFGNSTFGGSLSGFGQTAFSFAKQNEGRDNKFSSSEPSGLKSSFGKFAVGSSGFSAANKDSPFGSTTTGQLIFGQSKGASPFGSSGQANLIFGSLTTELIFGQSGNKHVGHSEVKLMFGSEPKKSVLFGSNSELKKEPPTDLPFARLNQLLETKQPSPFERLGQTKSNQPSPFESFFGNKEAGPFAKLNEEVVKDSGKESSPFPGLSSLSLGSSKDTALSPFGKLTHKREPSESKPAFSFAATEDDNEVSTEESDEEGDKDELDTEPDSPVVDEDDDDDQANELHSAANLDGKEEPKDVSTSVAESPNSQPENNVDTEDDWESIASMGETDDERFEEVKEEELKGAKEHPKKHEVPGANQADQPTKSQALLLEQPKITEPSKVKEPLRSQQPHLQDTEPEHTQRHQPQLPIQQRQPRPQPAEAQPQPAISDSELIKEYEIVDLEDASSAVPLEVELLSYGGLSLVVGSEKSILGMVSKIVLETNGHLDILKRNAHLLQEFIDAHGVSQPSSLDDPSLWTLVQSSELKDSTSGLREEIRDTQQQIGESDKRIVQLQKDVLSDQKRRVPLEQQLAQLKLVTDKLGTVSKNRPLDARSDMMRQLLRRKLQKVYEVYDGALAALMPLKAQTATSRDTVKHLEQAVVQVSRRIHAKQAEVNRLAEEIQDRKLLDGEANLRLEAPRGVSYTTRREWHEFYSI